VKKKVRLGFVATQMTRFSDKDEGAIELVPL
jgi:hypothetical protein